jgi:hypothetical protein
MNKVVSETQTYFTNVVNKSKETVNQYNNAVRQQWMLERNYTRGNFNVGADVNEFVVLFGKPNNVEKNWMPFEVNNELYFVYSISPHIILKCDIKTGNCPRVYSSNNIKNHEIMAYPLGGGAPAVRFTMKGESFFLTIAHTRHRKGEPIMRKNFFYVFRSVAPFEIIMIGSQFDIMDPYEFIEFGSGLLLSKDEKKVIISCGISDCYSVICEYNLDDILSSMKPTVY